MLCYVSSPLVRFIAIDPSELPEKWADAKYRVGLWILGSIPFGSQVIDISRGEFSDDKSGYLARLRDNGHSAVVARWDHWITVESAPGGCRYTDRVEIQAGIFTPLVWAFAWIFYRHRHAAGSTWSERALTTASFQRRQLDRRSGRQEYGSATSRLACVSAAAAGGPVP